MNYTNFIFFLVLPRGISPSLKKSSKLVLLSLNKRFYRCISHYTCNSMSTELLKLLTRLLASAEVFLSKALEGTNHSGRQCVYLVSNEDKGANEGLLTESPRSGDRFSFHGFDERREAVVLWSTLEFKSQHWCRLKPSPPAAKHGNIIAQL